MISELTRDEFYTCRDLLCEDGQIEAKAIIEGINPGRVFVDDRNSPTTGLIWLGNNDGFIFIGNEKNDSFNSELNQFIDSVIRIEAKKVGLDFFEGIGNHPKWNETIQKLFEHLQVGSWKQRVYILEPKDYRKIYEPDMEPGYDMVKLDESLFENKDGSIQNIMEIQDKVSENWASREKFFQEGIGYGIVYENNIVSTCFSGFVAEKTHSINIETLEKHRGKKLAQKLAHAFVQECLEKEYTPYWDCMESNKPSIAIAENVGFKKAFTYLGYEYYF